ncbi:MAG: TetR/AcrR family transcriptional regulator [Afipia sp.]|jgi:AcrR family transcriptional regulator|nr:TetR/AcrR family transcriptional regulator [Afipia sp.]
MSSRRTAKQGSNRQVLREREIINAARLVFESTGFDSASMADIAARAGIVEGTVYLYFDSKKELMHRVVAEWYEGLIASVSNGLARVSGVRGRIRFCILRHLRVYVEDTGLANLMIRELRRDKKFYETEIYSLNKRYAAFMTAEILEGIKQGELNSDIAPDVVRDLIFGGIEHYAYRILSGRGGLDIDLAADRILGTLWAGIAAPKNTSQIALEDRIARLERMTLANSEKS